MIPAEPAALRPNLRCWFGRHDRQIDPTNSGRKFCSRCGMKSLFMIPISGLGGYRGDKAYWQDISFPDEGFLGLRSQLRFWLSRKVYAWRNPT